MGLILITSYQFWSSQQIAVRLVCAKTKGLLWVETLGTNSSFPRSYSSLEIFLVMYRKSAGSAHFGASAFLTWMWILGNLLFEEREIRFKRRLIFQPSESSLRADILIVCFTSFEQWGSVQFVGSHAFHYTTPLWQRQLRGKNEPRDESSVWRELCGSNMDKSLVLTVCPLTHGKDLWQVMLMEPHTFSKECFVSRLWSHI